MSPNFDTLGVMSKKKSWVAQKHENGVIRANFVLAITSSIFIEF